MITRITKPEEENTANSAPRQMAANSANPFLFLRALLKVFAKDTRVTPFDILQPEVWDRMRHDTEAGDPQDTYQVSCKKNLEQLMNLTHLTPGMEAWAAMLEMGMQRTIWCQII